MVLGFSTKIFHSGFSVVGLNRLGQFVELEDILQKSWKELDQMLTCSQTPECVAAYVKTFQIGGDGVEANLVQSLSITIQQIKEIANRLKIMLKRD